MLVLCLLGAALADDFQPPNSVIQAAVGTPTLVNGRGEAWFGSEVSAGLGVGTLGDTDLGFDGTLHWRPGFGCFGCGDRNLVTLGAGLGVLVAPPVSVDDWSLAAGLDLDATFVHWFSHQTGLSVTVHGGGGPGWVNLDFDVIEPKFWVFGGVGLAF